MRRKPPSEVQSALQVALYGALEKCGGHVSTGSLAEQLDVKPSTVSRQSTGDIPVQAQTVVALGHLDPEAGDRLLRIVATAMHRDISAARPQVAAPTIAAMLSSLFSSAQCCSETAAMEYAAAHDGRIEAHELTTLEGQWASEDQARDMKRDRLRAMAGQQGAAVREVRA